MVKGLLIKKNKLLTKKNVLIIFGIIFLLCAVMVIQNLNNPNDEKKADRYINKLYQVSTADIIAFNASTVRNNYVNDKHAIYKTILQQQSGYKLILELLSRAKSFKTINRMQNENDYYISLFINIETKRYYSGKIDLSQFKININPDTSNIYIPEIKAFYEVDDATGKIVSDIIKPQ